MKKIYLLLLPLAVSVAFFSCSNSESRMPSADTALVTINLGLPPSSVANRSIPDRVFSFLVPDAVAAVTAPALFSAINVRVTGADIGVINQTFPPADSVSLSVPAGALRTFEVTATVAPFNSDVFGTWTAAESFSGTSQANLPAGASVSVPVLMKLGSSKIIVPDYYNNRLVIMNNMGAILTTLGYVYPATGAIQLASPKDIDFDARGRIYIVDANAVYRCDDINGSNAIVVYSNANSPAQVVAVDRNNDFVYLASGTTLLRLNLDGSAPSSLPGTVPSGLLVSLNGLDVGPDGNLLVSGMDGLNYTWGIFKIDGSAAGAGIIASYFNTTLMSVPYDIQSQGGAIYVLNPRGTPDTRLLQFADGPGSTFTLTGSGPLASMGAFSNAGHFSAVRSDGLVILDKPYTPTNSVIVFVMNAAGLGWASYTDATLNFLDYAGGG